MTTTLSAVNYRRLVEQVPAVVILFELGRGLAPVYVSPQTQEILGVSVEDWLEPPHTALACIHDDDRVLLQMKLVQQARGLAVRPEELRWRRPDGRELWLRDVSGVLMEDGRHLQAMLVDITEAKRSQAERRRVAAELLLAQKLEAIGRLAAGVAHEINTPVQYLGDTLAFLQESFDDVLALYDQVQAGTPAAEAEQNVDLPYLRERVPAAFERAADGIERVAAIVQTMGEQTHPAAHAPADLVARRRGRRWRSPAATPTSSPAARHLRRRRDRAGAREPAGQRRTTRSPRRQTSPCAPARRATTSGVGRGHRLRHPAARRRARVRPVLHHQGSRPRHRPGPRDRAQDRRRRHGGTLTFDTDPDVGTAFHVRLPDQLSQRALQPRERDDGLGRVRALVALAAAGAGQRLIHVLDRQHAERARHAGAQLDVLDPAGGLGADVVVVVGLAADDRAEAGHAGVAAGLGQVERGERELEGARDVVDVGLPHAGLGERALRARDQPLGQVLVEAARPRSRTSPRGPARGRWTASSWTICSSSARPWWCSVWPRRSRLARR